MATLDPKYIILNIVRTYVTANPITKDDDLANASVLHLYERGPEKIKNLFFTDNFDVVFFYGEPIDRGIRPIQDVPVHFQMRYPVTVVTVNKHDPILGPIVCTATTTQAKARMTLRAAIAASAQTGAGVTPAYTLIVKEERGRNDWMGGINIHRTPYYCEYTTGGP